MSSDVLYALSTNESDAAGKSTSGPHLDAELIKYRVLPPKQTAQLTGLSEATLERMRAANKGPRAIQLTERRIGYRIADIEVWLASRAAASESA